MEPESHQPYSTRALAAIVVVVTLGINLAFGLGRIDIARRDLIDTDGYMRYSRVVDLVTGRNGWWDGWIHWSNSPYGHSMHWTRPLDAILAVLAAPLAPFVGWRDAVYWAALASGPLLHLALVAAVAWAAAALMPRQAAALAALIAAIQPLVFGYTSIGRADHHILIAALVMVAIGGALRTFLADGAAVTAPARWSAVAAATALWVSTESLLVIGVVLGALTVDWVRRGSSRTAAAVAWSTWFAIAVVVAAFVELGPAHLGAVEYDRISLPHLVLAVSLAVMFRLVARLGDRPTQGVAARLAVAGGGALAVAAVLRVGFPLFFAGPFAELPDDLRTVWLDRIVESQPMWRDDDPIAMIATRLGVVLLAAPMLVALLRRGEPRARPAWWLVAALLIVTTAVALTSARFAIYPELVATLPLAAWCWQRIARSRGSSHVWAGVRRLGWLALAAVGWLVPALVVVTIAPPTPASATVDCELPTVSVAISDLQQPGQPAPAVLADIDLGPELHVRSGADVIATPHHRNVQGIRDARSIMRSPPDEARAAIDRRGIDVVLVCPDNDRGYLEPVPPGSLFDLLTRDEIPPWLQPVAVDSPTARLYEVRAQP
jgi:hypothetical protein